MNKIAITSDHAGYILKTYLIEYLKRKNFEIIDFGPDSAESVDYPDFGHKLGNCIQKGECQKGIAICGSGNGINMTVNKYSNVRSALCWSVEIARLARLHNDANILSLPARFITETEAQSIVEAFLNTIFEGGRHQKRVEKIPVILK